MKICLIRPPILVPVNNPMALYTPPVGLAYVAGALMAAGHEVQLIDAVGDDLDGVHRWDDDTYLHGMGLGAIVERIDPESSLIGFHCGFTFDWPVSRELIAMVSTRFPNLPLIAGGEHVNAMPAESLSESPLDLVVRGEGEETAVEIARVVERGEGDFSKVHGIAYRGADGALVKTSDRERLREIDKIEPPPWDITPIRFRTWHSHRRQGRRGAVPPVYSPEPAGSGTA